jgi:Flp pilus assembly protein TadD
MSSRRSIEGEASRWYEGGRWDYGHVGTPSEIIKDAGIVSGDSREVILRKIREYLLGGDAKERAQVMQQIVEYNMSDEELKACSESDKERFLRSWAAGWANAAVEPVLRRLRDEDEDW